MRGIQALVAKDFAVQGRSMRVYLVVGVLFFAYFRTMHLEGTFTVMFPVFAILYGFMNRSLMEDERQAALRFLTALPIPRKRIVQAKYLSIALVAVLTFLFFLTLAVMMGMNEDGGMESTVLSAAGLILALSLLVSFYLPVVFRIGVIRAQAMNRFFLIGLFAVSMLLGTASRYLSGGTLADRLESVSHGIERMNGYMLSILLLLAAAALYTASISVAVRFFDRRDL